MENTEDKKRLDYYIGLINQNSELFEGEESVNSTDFNDDGKLKAFIRKFKIQGEEDNFYNIYTATKTAILRDFCGKIIMISEVDNNSGEIPVYSI